MTKSSTKKNLSKVPYRAIEIAHYLLSLDPERKFFTKKRGNFRLNTLLHISQMLYCAKYGQPLFKDPMSAYPPKWELLNQKRQKQLSEIIPNPKIKTKKLLIYQLYQEQGIELSPQEEKLFWGVKR